MRTDETLTQIRRICENVARNHAATLIDAKQRHANDTRARHYAMGVADGVKECADHVLALVAAGVSESPEEIA